MPMRDRLARLVRRNPDRLSLRQRAASLRASIARIALRKAGAASPDPIFAVLQNDRALGAEHDRLSAASGPHPDGHPSWEASKAAHDAMWAHWRSVVLQTVPQTAAGCAALAAYANEWFERQGVDMDEDGPKILDLIARSALRMNAAPAEPTASIADASGSPDPFFAALSAAREAEAATKEWEAEHDAGRSDPAREMPLYNAAEDAREVAFETIPTTRAGRRALLDFIAYWIDRKGPLDKQEGADGEDTIFGEAYRALAAAIQAEEPEGPYHNALSSRDGFVVFEDAKGKEFRYPVGHWIAYMAQRLTGVAHDEFNRRFNSECAGLSRKDCEKLEGALRRELRMDAIQALHVGWEQAFDRGQATRGWTNPARVAAEEISLKYLDIHGLANAYESLCAASAYWDGWRGRGCSGRRVAHGMIDLNAFGEMVDFESERAGFIRDQVVAEIASRKFKNSDEQDRALVVRLRHEMDCENKIRDIGLLTEASQVWG